MKGSQPHVSETSVCVDPTSELRRQVTLLTHLNLLMNKKGPESKESRLFLSTDVPLRSLRTVLRYHGSYRLNSANTVSVTTLPTTFHIPLVFPTPSPVLTMSSVSGWDPDFPVSPSMVWTQVSPDPPVSAVCPRHCRWDGVLLWDWSEGREEGEVTRMGSPSDNYVGCVPSLPPLPQTSRPNSRGRVATDLSSTILNHHSQWNHNRTTNVDPTE